MVFPSAVLAVVHDNNFVKTNPWIRANSRNSCKMKKTYWNEEFKEEVVKSIQCLEIFSEVNIMCTADIVSVNEAKFKIVFEIFRKIQSLSNDFKQNMLKIAVLFDEIIIIIFNHFHFNPHFHFSQQILNLGEIYEPLRNTLLKCKLETTWKLLKRNGEKHNFLEIPSQEPSQCERLYQSKLGVSGAHIVPGGRFNEMYYWDSFFSAVGYSHEETLFSILVLTF